MHHCAIVKKSLGNWEVDQNGEKNASLEAGRTKKTYASKNVRNRGLKGRVIGYATSVTVTDTSRKRNKIFSRSISNPRSAKRQSFTG